MTGICSPRRYTVTSGGGRSALSGWHPFTSPRSHQRPAVVVLVMRLLTVYVSLDSEVDEWYTTVCRRMTRSKVKVTQVGKLRKWLISKYLPLGMHVIKRLMMNYDTPRQYLNFNWTDFWYSPSFGVAWPSNLGCFTFVKRNFLLRGVDRLSRVGAIFIHSVHSTHLCHDNVM